MRRPEGHQPSYPAFTARFPDATDTIVFAQFAISGPELELVTAAARELEARLAGKYGPRHLDRVRPVQEAGQHTRIALAYWDSSDGHHAWWASKEVSTWWESLPHDGPLAYWREVASIPVSRFESMHSGEWQDNGVSNFTPVEVTQLHDYWGGMRDRIRDSHNSELAPGSTGFGVSADGSLGRRITFHNPDNLAFIRTAQDWSHCADIERATYTQDVAPTLRTGADYIAANPASGCTAAAYVEELDADWSQPQDRTCVLAWWTSLAHLEEWTVNHPTHQAIFGAFHQMLQRHEFRLELRLWHEVCVLPAGAAEFEYINCVPGTGLLAALPPPASR